MSFLMFALLHLNLCLSIFEMCNDRSKVDVANVQT